MRLKILKTVLKLILKLFVLDFVWKIMVSDKISPDIDKNKFTCVFLIN